MESFPLLMSNEILCKWAETTTTWQLHMKHPHFDFWWVISWSFWWVQLLGEGNVSQRAWYNALVNCLRYIVSGMSRLFLKVLFHRGGKSPEISHEFLRFLTYDSIQHFTISKKTWSGRAYFNPPIASCKDYKLWFLEARSRTYNLANMHIYIQ